jgi:hypothetical protein
LLLAHRLLQLAHGLLLLAHGLLLLLSHGLCLTNGRMRTDGLELLFLLPRCRLAAASHGCDGA